MKKLFVSTAIDYPSEKPHLGHCLEKVQADVFARHKRSQGFEVHFSNGLDEHGLKIQRRAEAVGKNPQDFVDEMYQHFNDLWLALNISNNDFVRTSDNKHRKVVEKVFNLIYQKGDIYKGKYRGLYCVDCETYYLPKDLDNGNCPIHQRPVEQIEEESYFFKMSKYQVQLINYIRKNEYFILPLSKRKEILKRLEEPLQDLSISRKSVSWGLPLPNDSNLTLFVWVEALLNYFTTLNYPSEKFNKFWPADVHIIGKDIVWHHTVIWGSLLLSLGLQLPRTIFVHGFITINGEKMSKSLGNVVEPLNLVRDYGSDAVRYYLLSEIPSTKDGDFSIEKFEGRYNDDLAKGLGNLVSRILKLSEGIQPKLSNKELEEKIQKVKKEVFKALDNFKFNEALKTIWELISFCDKYIEKEKPWEGGKDEVISNLLFALLEIADLLKPFLPETSEKIIKQIKNREAEALFPRLD